MSSLVRTEQIHWNAASARLQQLGAQFLPDKSGPKRAVYYSRSQGIWIALEKRGDTAFLGYFTECPCKGNW